MTFKKRALEGRAHGDSPEGGRYDSLAFAAPVGAIRITFD